MTNSEVETSEEPSPLPDFERCGVTGNKVQVDGPPSFKLSHLWAKPVINPVNLKSFTLPIFNLNNPYSRIFHLSWPFFVAFLSWFAFPPLFPDAIKPDLKLTTAEVANSNVLALTATIIIRVFVGPLIDRYGPRKIMAGLLFLGAIPSGLAGTAHNASSLYALRFFIGILGATFVPCQAWTSAFFDKHCVGTANALVGGWGNMGGGATFAIMVSLYARLQSDGLVRHTAWRAAFAIVPVPVLLSVGMLVLYFGQDHPAGSWSQRHCVPATAISESTREAHELQSDANEKDKDVWKISDKHLEDGVIVTARQVDDDDLSDHFVRSPVDVAVNKALTPKAALEICINPLTWLPAFAYLTTFGLELAIDGQMANILYSSFNKKIHGFDQTKAGYYTSIFGFLNLVTRPFGGFACDLIYRRFGTKAKKYWTLACGIIMGVTFLAGGLYLENTLNTPHLPTLMGIFSLSAIFSEFGNGANFALVPHCNPRNNGVMSGIVGAFGSLGGIIFALIFRFEINSGKAIWVIGSLCIIINTLLVAIPVPKY